MSHVAKIEFEVHNLDALEEAAKELGLVLVKGQKTYRWYGHSVGDFPLPAGLKESDLGKCDHALVIPNNNSAYEIGIVKSKTHDGYELLWDFWAGGHGLQEKVGTDGNNLKDSYLASVTVRNMRRRGKKVIRERTANGEIVIRGR